MSFTGALYWLFFLLAIVAFAFSTESRTAGYLLAGLLVVMTGLIKLESDRRRTPDAQEGVNRLREDHDKKLAEVTVQASEAGDRLAKKILVLENDLLSLKALVTEKYAVRSGRAPEQKKKKPALPESE